MVLGKQKPTPASYYAQPPAAPQAAPNMVGIQHNLESRVKTLDQRIQKCDADLVYYKKEMAKYRPGTGNHTSAKQRAARVLKQRSQLDQQRSSALSQQMNIDSVTMAVDSMQDHRSTVLAMEDMNRKLAKELKSIDVDRAEDLQYRLEEALNESNYISEALGRDYTVDGIDDAELESQLDNIEEELYVGSSSAIPQQQHPMSYVTPQHGMPSQYANSYAPSESLPSAPQRPAH